MRQIVVDEHGGKFGHEHFADFCGGLPEGATDVIVSQGASRGSPVVPPRSLDKPTQVAGTSLREPLGQRRGFHAGTLRPDHVGLEGELLCRGCALGAGIDDRLKAGRRSGRVGAVTAIVIGIAILVCVIGFASVAVVGATVRLAALVGSVGVMRVVWSVRDLEVLRPR